MKTRINEFDIAKGLGILLVVMGHLEYISEPLRYFIVAFHMPLFFVISGMLMYVTGEEKGDKASFIKRKLLRMGLPYISYTLAYLVIETIYGFLTHTFSHWMLIQDAWLGLCLYGISVLWFLPAMFFGMLMLYFLRRHSSHGVTAALVVVLTVAAYFLSMWLESYKAATIFDFIASELYYPMAMAVRCIFALFYLTAGYYLMMGRRVLAGKAREAGTDGIFDAAPASGTARPSGTSGAKRGSVVRAAGCGVAGVMLLVLVAWLSSINGAVDIHFMIFGNPFIYLTASLAGSLGVILISSALEDVSETLPCRIIRFYGVNSLTVMATHINFYVLYGSILAGMFIIKYINHAKGYLFCPIILVIVFLIEAVVIRVVNRFCPFFTGRRGG